jgi:hypothetical protein
MKYSPLTLDVDMLGRRRLHAFSFEEASVPIQKAASPSCLRERLRILTDNQASRLNAQEPSRSSFPRMRASCVRRCVASSFEEAPHVANESTYIPGPTS